MTEHLFIYLFFLSFNIPSYSVDIFTDYFNMTELKGRNIGKQEARQVNYEKT